MQLSIYLSSLEWLKPSEYHLFQFLCFQQMKKEQYAFLVHSFYLVSLYFYCEKNILASFLLFFSFIFLFLYRSHFFLLTSILFQKDILHLSNCKPIFLLKNINKSK